MKAGVRVTTIQRRIDHRNPISGHEWHTYGPVTGYEVRGPLGVISKHRSEARAEAAAAEWREFYDEHPIPDL
uniref:Uncharacterized protein n=1 Tax=viral metagenome TaxID=1070528 RepID=A0A6M3M5V1_9ZZZZ